METTTVQAVLDDFRSAPVPERLRAALGLLEAMTRRPAQPATAELDACRVAGLPDEAIEDAANVGFHFNLINRVADALDFPLPSEQQLPKVAKLLDRAGNIFGGKRLQPSWLVGVDGIARPVEVEDGRAHLLAFSGATTPALRRAVEAHAARALGGHREADDAALTTEAGAAAQPLRTFLDKLARHAYRVLDEDVQALKGAGLSEEAIFELTVVGATGAALVGLEGVYVALATRPSASTSPRAITSTREPNTDHSRSDVARGLVGR